MRALLLLMTLTFPGYPALVLTLNPSTAIGVEGGTVTFEGILENTGAFDVFLNDINLAFTPPAGTYLTNDPNFFFANVPGVLLPGESYTGPIFHLLIAPGTPPADYSGVVSILGGDDEFALDALNAGDFTVQMTPEPATLLLMAGALAALAIRCKLT
jgi:hypothetical protein